MMVTAGVVHTLSTGFICIHILLYVAYKSTYLAIKVTGFTKPFLLAHFVDIPLEILKQLWFPCATL